MMKVDFSRDLVGNVLTDGNKLYKVVPFVYYRDGNEEVPCIIRESSDPGATVNSVGYPFSYVQNLITGERYACCGAQDIISNPNVRIVTDGDILLDNTTHELIDVCVYNNKPTVYGNWLTYYDMARFRLVKSFTKNDIISCIWAIDMYKAVLKNGACVWMTHSQYCEVNSPNSVDCYSYVYSPYFNRCIMY